MIHKFPDEILNVINHLTDIGYKGGFFDVSGSLVWKSDPVDSDVNLDFWRALLLEKQRLVATVEENGCVLPEVSYREFKSGVRERSTSVYIINSQSVDACRFLFDDCGYGEDDLRDPATGEDLADNSPEKVKERREVAFDLVRGIERGQPLVLRKLSRVNAYFRTLREPDRRVANEWGDKLWDFNITHYRRFDKYDNGYRIKKSDFRRCARKGDITVGLGW